MINAVLIANRGEIACRIIRTARRLGIRTVVVYSDVDAHSLAVHLADEAHSIGSPESYLNIPKLLAVAKAAKIDAIHPGYGFLSENPNFAQACREAGFIFIGPSVEALQKMGSKDEAKAIARKLDIPVIPGDEDKAATSETADRLGYPLMIKAVMGGGGRGMRRVSSKEDFKAALDACRREAQASFGNGDVLLEKYIANPRHIEVQLFGDAHGNLVHLFERDCSLQRHHQKVIEEAPSCLPLNIKQKLYESALKLGHAIHYEGAGTVEFLVDETNHFYFMEMNTRLQVEHPITEAITGIDLVEWQFRVASQEKLPLVQHEISRNGYALEARLYAEDPFHHFKPVTGKIWMRDIPQNGRIDTGVHPQDTITPYYDSLLAKLIVTGNTRAEMLYRASLALENWTILGIQTNASFLKRLLHDKDVLENHIDTGFIDRHTERFVSLQDVPEEVYRAASLIKVLSPESRNSSPWDEKSNWRIEGHEPLVFEWVCREKIKTVQLTFPFVDANLPFWETDEGLSLAYQGEIYFLKPHILPLEHALKKGEKTHLKAPLTGKVSLLFVTEGQLVQENQPLLILEAMKMEHMIASPRTGKIRRLFYQVGDIVKEGADVVDIQEEENVHDLSHKR